MRHKTLAKMDTDKLTQTAAIILNGFLSGGELMSYTDEWEGTPEIISRSVRLAETLIYEAEKRTANSN